MVVRLGLNDPKPGQLIVIAAESQGCADIGLCYPPTVQHVQLALPEAGKAPVRAEPGAESGLVRLSAQRHPKWVFASFAYDDPLAPRLSSR